MSVWNAIVILIMQVRQPNVMHSYSFVMSAHGHIVVRVRIDGVVRKLLLDTGSPDIVIQRRPPSGRSKASHSSKRGERNVCTVSIGDIVRRVSVREMDLSGYDLDGTDGLLGISMFDRSRAERGCRFSIDLHKRLMTATNHSGDPMRWKHDSGSYSLIMVKRDGFHYYVKGTVNGKQCNLLVDTGSQYPLIVGPIMFHNLTKNLDRFHRSIIKITIGSYTRTFTSPMPGESDNINILGLPMFEDAILTLDFEKQRLIVCPVDSPTALARTGTSRPAGPSR